MKLSRRGVCIQVILIHISIIHLSFLFVCLENACKNNSAGFDSVGLLHMGKELLHFSHLKMKLLQGFWFCVLFFVRLFFFLTRAFYYYFKFEVKFRGIFPSYVQLKYCLTGNPVVVAYWFRVYLPKTKSCAIGKRCAICC